MESIDEPESNELKEVCLVFKDSANRVFCEKVLRTDDISKVHDVWSRLDPTHSVASRFCRNDGTPLPDAGTLCEVLSNDQASLDLRVVPANYQGQGLINAECPLWPEASMEVAFDENTTAGQMEESIKNRIEYDQQPVLQLFFGDRVLDKNELIASLGLPLGIRWKMSLKLTGLRKVESDDAVTPEPRLSTEESVEESQYRRQDCEAAQDSCVFEDGRYESTITDIQIPTSNCDYSIQSLIHLGDSCVPNGFLCLSNKTLLLINAFVGNLRVVKEILGMEAKSKLKSSTKATSLQMASREGHTKIVDLVHDIDDINARDNFGNTALILAAKGGHADIVKLLIDSKCKKDIRNRNENNAFICAVLGGHLNVVKLLLPHFQKECSYALNLAAFMGHEEVVRFLIKEEADVNYSHPSSGGTPLIAAVSRGHEAVVVALLEQPSCDVNQRNKDGDAAVVFAARCRSKSIMERLIAKKCLIPDRAVKESAKDPEMLKMILSAKGYKKGDPLMKEVSRLAKGDEKCVRMLDELCLEPSPK